METRVIQLCTHQKNIDRYQGLLKTKLNEPCSFAQMLRMRLSTVVHCSGASHRRRNDDVLDPIRSTETGSGECLPFQIT